MQRAEFWRRKAAGCSMIYTCEQPGCGKTWDTDGEQFPLCITFGCPLRGKRDNMLEKGRAKRMRWPDESVVEKSIFTRSASTILGIKKSKSSIKETIQKYKLGKNKQKAKTRLRKCALFGSKLMIIRENIFETRDNMHSEMRAIAHMLGLGFWVLRKGRITWKYGAPVDPAFFITEEPHCGFCTLLLHVLGLPLTTPTFGNYNLAGNFLYPLPVQVKRSPHVLARLISGDSYTAFHLLKLILNAFIPLPPEKWVLKVDGALYGDSGMVITFNGEVLDWEWVCQDRNGEILEKIWRHVFSCIYQDNQKKNEKKE